MCYFEKDGKFDDIYIYEIFINNLWYHVYVRNKTYYFCVFQQGHMKIHSGSMNQLASTASSQSSEGKVVERMEESTHRKLRGEDAKNTSEESTNKLSLTEHSVSTADDRPEDTA